MHDESIHVRSRETRPAAALRRVQRGLVRAESWPAGADRPWNVTPARRCLVCKGSPGMAKRRLDALLAERGLFSSRSRAAASVMAGEVRVGAAERRAQKPGELVDVEEQLSVDERPAFVSRGGIKLANALEASGLDVGGRRALDVGASTGGFTDCLLQRGAREVIAVDVGYGTLAWSLRNDPRVTVLERTQRARADARQMLPVRARPAPVRRRVVHLAREGARRGARLPRARLRRARAGQAAVRGRPRARRQGRRRARRRRSAARRCVGVGEAALALGAARARLSLLGPARAEGQPRDVRVAGRPGARRGASGASCRRRARRSSSALAREVEP